MTALDAITFALPLEETCDEISAAMQREGFIPKERHRLDPAELGLTGAKNKGVLVIMDFEPGGLAEEDSALDPLHAALCLCQVVCQATGPQYTRVTFADYKSMPELDEDVPTDFSSLVQRRLIRVHTALNRRV